MKKLNPLKYLERTDKWYLGGGNRLLWAPPFPIWLDYPGFWDKAHYYNYELEPVFTWTVLDEEGKQIHLRVKSRKWDPSKLVSRFEVIGDRLQVRGLRFEESKACLPNDVLTSVVRIKNTSTMRRKLHLMAWTTQPNYPFRKTTWLEEVKYHNGTISFVKHLYRPDSPHLAFACSFAIDKKVESFSINLSEGSVIQPYWKLTPFSERMLKGKLSNEANLSGVTEDGLVYMALHSSIELRAKSEEQIAVFFSASPAQAESSSNIHFVTRQKEPIKVSEQNWNDFFSGVPYFECSDEYLTRCYWYRWYGLRLNTIDVQEGNYQHPFVAEGIDYFRAPISYSAPCHILETRWMHDPKLAQGILLTFLDTQRVDGRFQGYIDPFYYRQKKLRVREAEPFYHANWGKALQELHVLHPDLSYLTKVYDALVKYVEYFDRERDAEGSGLYDIHNHYETGQEYSSRYLSVNPNADKENWGEVFRLRGVDVTVYLYELKKTLAWIAKMVNGEKREVEKWREGVQKIRQAILEKMWDPDNQMFFDVDPSNGRRTMVRTVTCFYPYLTDIVSEDHVEGLKKHLLNPKEFWTKFPVPSLSVNDEFFSPESEWKGKRMNCPWNGRVWPMTNSHIAEALAQTAIRFNDDELKKRTVEFITKFIRMMFSDGDPKRPNCYEHYNPFTGQPSLYRGVDDYMHSWMVDLIIKYVAGIRPSEGEIIVDPFPFRLQHMVIDNVFIRDQSLKVERQGKKFSVWLNGKKYSQSVLGKPIVVA